MLVVAPVVRLPREAAASSPFVRNVRIEVGNEAMEGGGVTTWDYALAALLRLVPLGTHDGAPWADDSHATQLARYEGISTAIWDACGDDRDCAALLVALAVGESAAARDADEGPCFRKGAYRTRCDSGAAFSVWQTHRLSHEVTGEMLFADRTLAAKQTLRVARGSLRLCRHLSPERRLSGLSGRCIDAEGPWVARYRLWQTVRAWRQQ